jgi:hypothetical protein
VLLVTGLFILDLVPLKMPNVAFSMNLLRKLGDSGLAGAVLLGLLFALSFCPLSAALFFGSVIPLSLKFQSRFFLPLCYGIGTAAPVIVFAMVIAYSSRLAGIFFNRLAVAEKWLRRITGVLFMAVGSWFCLKYLLKVIS